MELAYSKSDILHVELRSYIDIENEIEDKLIVTYVDELYSHFMMTEFNDIRSEVSTFFNATYKNKKILVTIIQQDIPVDLQNRVKIDRQSIKIFSADFNELSEFEIEEISSALRFYVRFEYIRKS